MYAVILAGGGGTRLRPLSRPDLPKPFLPLLGEETLIARTMRRLDGLVERDDLFVVTDRRYAVLAREQLELPSEQILAEPVGRNTAPAVAYAVAAIDRPDDDVMAVLPADHAITDERRFRDVLRVAVERLALGAFGIESPLVTLGVEPTRPATEYGYVMPRVADGAQVDGLRAFPVERFEEKPAPTRASALLATPAVAWNAGMFAWRRGAIRDLLLRYTDILGPIASSLAGGGGIAGAYDQISPISIDYAVLEPAAVEGRVVMAAMDVGWSDLGSWSALLDALGAPGVETRIVEAGESVETSSEDLVVTGSPRIATVVGGGSMTAHQPIALLRGAARFEPIVDELIRRCAQMGGSR